MVASLVDAFTSPVTTLTTQPVNSGETELFKLLRGRVLTLLVVSVSKIKLRVRRVMSVRLR